MIFRTLAISALLAGSAWAQTADTAAPALQSAAPSPPAAAAAAALPSDPMDLAHYALANAQQTTRCRFAFDRAVTVNAHAGWTDSEADLVVHFDPRLALGTRWTVIRAARQQRAVERQMQQEDRKGFPSDLMMLTAQGEWTYEDLALHNTFPDHYVFSYRPAAITDRNDTQTGTNIIDQLVGELEVSRTDGRLLRSELHEPRDTAVRSLAIVRVQHALISQSFSNGANDMRIADGGSMMYQMSALLTQTALTTTFRYSNIEPICDPAEVARIVETEAAGVSHRHHH
jgi:hypothetical protein